MDQSLAIHESRYCVPKPYNCLTAVKHLLWQLVIDLPLKTIVYKHVKLTAGNNTVLSEFDHTVFYKHNRVCL